MVNRIYGETESLMSKGLMPGGLLRELDGFVQQHFSRTEMFFSVCSGLLDFKRKALYYSNYGHPPQILHQRQRNTIHLLKSQTHLLGIEAGQDPKAVFEGTLSFDNKDRIILFTDGLIETMGQDKELYGMQRLEGFARNHISDHPALFNTNLLKEVNEFRIGPVTDDIFLLVIDIK
jgi:serine phosphatase RsbU (regulator of sigma subunit)